MTKKEPFKVHEKDTKTKQKTQLSVRMHSSKVVVDFKNYVRGKYEGHFYSFMGLELEYAMKKHLRDNHVEGYVDSDPDTFYGSSVTHTNLKTADYCLIDYLKTKYSEGDEVLFDDLADVMRKKLNLKDQRTHRSHVARLEALQLLIKGEGVKYVTYYYKKAPKLTNAEKKEKIVNNNKIYSILIKNNYLNKNITRARFEEITCLKGPYIQNAIKELEELNLMEYKSPGKWYVNDSNGNPLEETSNRPTIPPNDNDYLSKLSNAKTPEENKGILKWNAENLIHKN